MAPPTPRAAVLGFLLSLFAGPLLGVGFAVSMAMQGSDAWFGLQTKLVCEEVCDGCHGPVERRGGTKVIHGRGRGTPSKMYCQPPRGSLDGADDIERYEVSSRGSDFFLYGAIAPAFVLVWAVSFAVLRAVFVAGAAREKGELKRLT